MQSLSWSLSLTMQSLSLSLLLKSLSLALKVKSLLTSLARCEIVNVHNLESVGNKIIEDMIGKSAFTYKFKRNDRAKTIGNISAMKIARDRTIDPALLFQRFLVVSRPGDLSLDEVLSYELSPFPPALFETRNILRKTDKPQLAQQFETMLYRLIK